MKPFHLYYLGEKKSEHVSLAAAKSAGKRIVARIEKQPIKTLSWSFLDGEWFTYWDIKGWQLFAARLNIRKVQS